MINKLKRITQSKFVRNVAIVATGTAGAQAITMAFSPVITRLYGPEAFGVLGTFTAILAVLSPIAALSYPIAIVLPKRDADAIGLAKLSMGIALATSLLAAVILLLFKAPIVNTLNLQAVGQFVLLLPLAMIFTAALAVMRQWVIRKKLFKVKAKIDVLQALWLNSAKAGVGLLSPVAAVLVFLATLGSALHAIMLWTSVWKNPNGKMVLSPESVESRTANNVLARRYRDFAYYRTPQIVLNASAQSMPVLMLASFFGPAAAGFYALTRLALGAPTALIGQSVADVFYPKFVERLQAGKNGRDIIIKSCLALLGVGLAPYLIIIFFGPVIFSLIFGEEWLAAGEFARWMSIWLLSTLVTRPVIAAIPALGLQKEFLIFEILALAARAVAIVIGFLFFSSAVSAVAVFSLASFIIYLGLALFVIKRA